MPSWNRDVSSSPGGHGRWAWSGSSWPATRRSRPNTRPSASWMSRARSSARRKTAAAISRRCAGKASRRRRRRCTRPRSICPRSSWRITSARTPSQRRMPRRAYAALAEPLVDQVVEIASAVAALNGQIRTRARRSIRVRALSSPGGAGQVAEIGLANTLKSFGLEEGRDYRAAIHAPRRGNGPAPRPDAVVFLPGNSALVIDCKASKSCSTSPRPRATRRRRRPIATSAATMNQHLRALADKGLSRRGARRVARCRARRRDRAHAQRHVSAERGGAREALPRRSGFPPQGARRRRSSRPGPAALHCAHLARRGRDQPASARPRTSSDRRSDAAAARQRRRGAGPRRRSVGKGIKAAAESFAELRRFGEPRAAAARAQARQARRARRTSRCRRTCRPMRCTASKARPSKARRKRSRPAGNAAAPAPDRRIANPSAACAI